MPRPNEGMWRLQVALPVDLRYDEASGEVVHDGGVDVETIELTATSLSTLVQYTGELVAEDMVLAVLRGGSLAGRAKALQLMAKALWDDFGCGVDSMRVEGECLYDYVFEGMHHRRFELFASHTIIWEWGPNDRGRPRVPDDMMLIWAPAEYWQPPGETNRVESGAMSHEVSNLLGGEYSWMLRAGCLPTQAEATEELRRAVEHNVAGPYQHRMDWVPLPTLMWDEPEPDTRFPLCEDSFPDWSVRWWTALTGRRSDGTEPGVTPATCKGRGQCARGANDDARD